MKKRFQLIALLAVALLGACSGGKDKVAVEQVDEKPRVKLADVKARPVEQIHEYTATVEAEVKNNIAPSSPVRIDRILVEVGDRVSKGQKLVSMDEANLKQTKFQLDNQEIEFKRMDELYKVGGASKSEWDAAKMALDIKETAYRNLLENTALLSPINGVVTARNYDSGDMYSGGMIEGSTSGSFFHWLIRLILFVALWAVTYGIIAAVKWLTDNWVLVLCIMGGVVVVVGIATVIAIIIRKRKNKAGLEVPTNESN